MNKFTDYSSKTTDWRQQLRVNASRTRVVIGIFILIYVIIGLIVDLYIHPELDRLPLEEGLIYLLTFKIVPIATLISGLIAVISILITFSLYDRIMLLGTEYHEITLDSKASLAEQQLYNVIEELKISAGLRYMPKVYLIEADYMNAFASGYSEKSALVAITRGLLNKLERSELQAVMAHELSHIRHQDIKLTLMASVLTNLMLIIIDILFRGVIYSGRSSRRKDEKGGGNGLVVVIILLRFLLPILTIFLTLYLSRKREFMADAGAVELIRDNVPLAKALIKISEDHQAHHEQYAALYRATPHEEVRYASYIFDPTQKGFSVSQSLGSIFSTHPSLDERLKALGFNR